MDDYPEVYEAIASARAACTDLHEVEIKASVGKLPRSVPETLSSFANGSGGFLILGLAEDGGFKPAPGFDARSVMDALAGACERKVYPPIRPVIHILPFEGAQIVTASIVELSPSQKPCYVTDRGMYGGSFIRTGDGDRRLTSYEIDRLLEERSQPRHDCALVCEASVDDLDHALLGKVIQNQRLDNPRVFGAMTDEDAMIALGIVGKSDDGGLLPSLAGLLAFGTYPQRYLPRLKVSFAVYPGLTKASADGTKFLDSRSFVGSIPDILTDVLHAVRRNSRVGGVLKGPVRVEVPDYPEEVVRELVCNALLHRDYSPAGCGSQVQVNMYPDRLEVMNPGGLYGAVTVDTLGELGANATRNARLASLLEILPFRDGFVAENHGTGYFLVKEILRREGMQPPVIFDSPAVFRVTVKRNDVLDRRAEGVRAGSRGVVIGRADLDGNIASVTGHDATVDLGAGIRASEVHQVELPIDPILAFLKATSQAKAGDIAAATGVSRSTVNYRLRKYLKEGLIEVVNGSGSSTDPNRYYRLMAI